MKKIETRLISLASKDTKTYTIILAESGGGDVGMRIIPIHIKLSEANFMKVAMENAETNNPQTQDVMYDLIKKSGSKLVYIYVFKLIEGIFHCKMNMINSSDTEYEVECSIGDGVCMSLMYNIPVLISEEIMDKCSFIMNSDGSLQKDTATTVTKNDLSYASEVSLEAKLKIALEEEDFKKAAMLRDEINNRKTQ